MINKSIWCGRLQALGWRCLPLNWKFTMDSLCDESMHFFACKMDTLPSCGYCENSVRKKTAEYDVWHIPRS